MTHPQDDRRMAKPYMATAQSPAFAESDRALFEAMQQLSSNLLFRVDLLTNHVELLGKMCEAYDLPKTLEDFPQSVFAFVAPDDRETLLQMMQDMRHGLETVCDIRLKAKDSTLRWHRNEYLLHYDANGTPIEALGKISDVHEKKELETKLARDGLTGCLRREAFEALCGEYMHNAVDKSHALFIIDIDNFKAINDNLGHHFGDIVLRETGDRLRSIFRSSDYIGRVGGDEFMVFMRDVSDFSLVAKKAEEIVDAMDVTYKGKSQSYHISGSVGLALAPHDGGDFLTLYKNADTALYDVKNRGKNGYLRYHNALSKGTMENTTPFDLAARSTAQHFNQALLADVFDLLFESKALDISMHQVLQLVGKALGVSRCYVFEQSKTVPDAYTNTYEWCAPGISAEIENLDCLPAALVRPFFDKANDAGILYCNDLTALKDDGAYTLMAQQGVQSFLHAYTSRDNQVSYVFGFDECTTPRVWSPMEISTIMYVSRIVAQFLNYKNALEQTSAVSEERLAVLDSLNYFSYIIDPEDHSLRYFNKAVQDKLPDLKIGDTCYMHLRGFGHECETCPLKQMRERKEKSARGVVYNQLLDMYVLLNAVWLPHYEGKECIFVSSNDVTDLIDPAHPCMLEPKEIQSDKP